MILFKFQRTHYEGFHNHLQSTLRGKSVKITSYVSVAQSISIGRMFNIKVKAAESLCCYHSPNLHHIHPVIHSAFILFSDGSFFFFKHFLRINFFSYKAQSFHIIFTLAYQGEMFNTKLSFLLKLPRVLNIQSIIQDCIFPLESVG